MNYNNKEDDKKVWRMVRIAYFILVGFIILKILIWTWNNFLYLDYLKEGFGSFLAIIGISGLGITLVYYFLIYLVNKKFFKKKI